MAQVITIGETMATLTPQSQGPLRYVSDYKLRIAGAESNVAIGLAKLGVDVAWVSRLGEDEFGHFICNQTRAEGVDCRSVIFDETHRTGVMFKEIGVGETSVFYYRENSAASHLCPQDLPASLFEGASILHLTGITPVLSESCREMTWAAIELARKNGLMLSFDPNIRRKLWAGQDYAPLIRQITLESHIVLLGLDEAEALFGTREEQEVLDVLFEKGNARCVAIKDGARGALVADRKDRIKIPPYPCRSIDPVGAGDGFNAGFLAGILQTGDVKTAGRMGAVCGAMATQTLGDVEGYPDSRQMKKALGNEEIIYR